MQFNDLTAQQNRIKEKLDRNIQAVMKHGQYIMGPEIKELEKTLAVYVGVRHAIACSSGTDALLLSLMSYGIGRGDTIFTTPFTFIATAEVISLLGAVPVFVDIEPATFNMDPTQLDLAIKAFISNNRNIYPLPKFYDSSPVKPRGVIPVNLFGLPADYNRINEIAKFYNLFVIEDAAQSFGAEYFGKKSCSLADVGCTSFFPAKPLGCYGDGGMCFTDDDEKAAVMRSLLVHGKGEDKYDNIRIGINGRLDTLQAAILNAKFDIFPEEVELRDKVARRYNDIFSTLGLQITIPQVHSGYRSVWAQYSVLAKDSDHRASLLKTLQDNKIPTAIYYPKPLHMQEAFAVLGYKKGDFPVSEDMASRIFSLPMHPYLAAEDQKKIADIIHG